MSMFYDLLMAQSKKEKEPIWLEYLESDGNQWIDTEYANKSDKQTISATFELSATSKNCYIMGNIGDPSVLKVFWQEQETLIVSNQGNVYTYSSNVARNVKHNMVSICEVGKKISTLLDDRAIAESNNVVVSINKQRPMLLFCYNPYASDTFIKDGKIYSVQLYDNDVLVRNFRPCLNPDTLKPAMYDTVEKKYYYNKGTGEFKYEHTFTKLDYLESVEDGQYGIKTGLQTTSEMTIESEFSTNISEKGMCLFGGRTSFAVDNVSFWAIRNTADGYIRFTYGVDRYDPYDDDPLKYVDKTYIKMDKNKYTLEGKRINIKGEMSEQQSFTASDDFYLFDSSKGDGTMMGFSYIGKVYYFKIADRNIIKRDYIPVRKDDGVICLYDFITGEYYNNIYEQSKFKGYLNGYQVGESIKATGLQYIDTGVKSNFKTSYTYTYMNCEAPSKSTMGIFGAREAYGQECTNAFCTSTGSTFTLRLDMLDPSIVTPAIGENRIVEYIINGEKTIIDGEIYTTTEKPNRLAPYSDYIFNINRRNAPDATGFTGSCSCWLNITDNVPVINLIPVKKDNFIGMLDTLTMKEYHNRGRGNFIFNA